MKLILFGDMLFSSRNLAKRLDQQLVNKISSADASFANAEFTTPEADKTVAAGRGYVTAVRPEALKELENLQVNLVSFANNHSGDFGIAGMKDTLAAAKKHNLIASGLAPSLDEARLAQFYDTESERVAFISLTATRADVFKASNAGNGVPARVGVNPLRWHEVYQVNEDEFDQIKQISNHLGLTASNAQGRVVEGWSELTSDQFQFGSLFEKNLLFKRGQETKFKTEANQEDIENLQKSIEDAKKRSDFVFVDVHTHEGVDGNWYADEPADFFVDAAHKAIDAGANIVIGHGAHFMRGAEEYKGKLIFYNLGSLIMEFEAGNSIIPPEMYEAYGLPSNSKPSDLHGKRTFDADGAFIGFGADRKFSQNIGVEISIPKNEEPKVKLIPLDLGLNRENPVLRGLPKIADQQEALNILNRLNELSSAFQTSFVLNEEENSIELATKSR
ncbi:CapA family protein [Fructobacillus pseudoficulneus]|nr:CapA family protein [Fructobacillus pseudoficulneus]SEH44980.1 poly-gamma-glutamate synthesis protein (capsule biosynthesis protein) [Fructobacillus pseudoficulneus]